MKIIPATILLTLSMLATALQIANSGPNQAASQSSNQAARQSKTSGKTSKPLPPGEGKQLVLTYCSHCHALTVVTRERRTRDDWISEIQSMAGKGMDADPDQMLVILNYLSKNFGPAKSAHKDL